MKTIMVLFLSVLSLPCFAATVWEAAASGDLASIQNYIENVGVKIDSVDKKSGDTLLSAAVKGGQLPVVKYLLDKGAALTLATDKPGMDILYRALDDGLQDPRIVALILGKWQGKFNPPQKGGANIVTIVSLALLKAVAASTNYDVDTDQLDPTTQFAGDEGTAFYGLFTYDKYSLKGTSNF
jgi:ankyrin repeat protein